MRILKWTGIVAAVGIVMVLLVLAYLVWSTDHRLESQLTALREAGEPVTWADLKRKPVPPEKNAATYLGRAESDLDSLFKELSPLWPRRDQYDRPLTAEEQKTIQAAFDAYPKVMPLLEQAAACEDFDREVDYAAHAAAEAKEGYYTPESDPDLYLPIENHRIVARVLTARVHYLLSKQQYDEALRASIILLRLSRHFQREPMIVSYLIAVACERLGLAGANDVLQAGPVSKQLRNDLDAELARHDNLDGCRWAMETEQVHELSENSYFSERMSWFTRARRNSEELKYLRDMDAYLKSLSGSHTEAVAARRRIETEFLGRLDLPAMQASHDAAVRTRALVRCLRVINALQARVPPGSNAVPKLAQLGLPPEATTDPFTDKPLAVKKLPDGWLVYSVGEDFEDNGGDIVGSGRARDYGFGPPSLKAKAAPEEPKSPPLSGVTSWTAARSYPPSERA